MFQPPERMVDIWQSRFSWPIAVLDVPILGHQVEDSDIPYATPHPNLPGLWMSLVGVMPKVLRHGWPFLTQCQCQAGIKMIVRCNSMSDRLRIAQQDIARNFIQHAYASRTGILKGRIFKNAVFAFSNSEARAK
jgi:hypothetical protein